MSDISRNKKCNMDTVYKYKNYFESLVDKRSENQCWRWLGNFEHTGIGSGDYGRIWMDGSSFKAHRVAWALKHGVWPSKFITHSCDHKWCVNPNHLSDQGKDRNLIEANERGLRPQKYNRVPDDIAVLVILFKELGQTIGWISRHLKMPYVTTRDIGTISRLYLRDRLTKGDGFIIIHPDPNARDGAAPIPVDVGILNEGKIDVLSAALQASHA